MVGDAKPIAKKAKTYDVIMTLNWGVQMLESIH